MNFEIKILIGITLGFIAYSALYLGKCFQKHGIEGFKDQGKVSIKNRHGGIWIFGTFLASIHMFVQWAALFFAPINLVAPIEGLGLVVLVVFSYYFLKESIFRLQLIGITLIIIGTVFITFFNTNPSEILFSSLKVVPFLIITLSIIPIELIIVGMGRIYDFKRQGLVLAITAGTFMALQTVTKRITAIPNSTLSLIFIFITFLFAVLTLLTTQYAFAKANANLVVPSFTSASIIIAIVTSSISLSEIIVEIQLVGFVLIVFGVIFLTAFSKHYEKH
ncbi:MAG: DMT family transporter [Promethearchaeota archaeon]